MGYTVIDRAIENDPEHLCDLPYEGNFNRGAVIECDECCQRYVKDKFGYWAKTDWGKEKR